MAMSALVWRSALIPLLLLLVHGGSFSVDAQRQPTTAIAEAEALKAVFKKWGIASKMNWNSTEDPCSGVARSDSVAISDTNYDPFIKCDCSANNGATCHITALKVYALDVIGEIPDELWNLTFLTDLNIAQNYLTGSISPSIVNLKNMQYMTFGINALSGELPKELGQLTDLKSLAFGTNNFSGSLPSEIGNIVGLQQLYMDSSGISGKIPATFTKLSNMQTLWASDTELSGTIPNFIGNWTQLTDLRLEGNSFVGSIPSSFSNLTSLQTLRIGDLSNGSSSLAFITNLTSLNTLVLRNINFSDAIPSGIGGLTKLNYLDLSFNNITGKIPDSLFSLGSLSFVFLGNNKVTGSLPLQKSSSLVNLDLSYNQLSGDHPSWVTGSNLHLNLVANNFTATSVSGLPSGLSCLQNSFPCNRGSPKYSSFAVKCGGPQIKSSEGTVYEQEDESLGSAAYYVGDTDKWGVSNAGYFLFNSNVSYTASTTRQVINSLDAEIFQTARLSPGSLRYYGLGLQNGNYTVTLQFVELIIQNGQTWRSLGQRVFDIYIQGYLAVKNFDIRKEAGGLSFTAVKKQFIAEVTENYMEIHLFWAGKGTCCVPFQGTYGPSISAVSIVPNFTPSIPNEASSYRKKTALILAVVIHVGFHCLLFMAVI